MANWIEVSVDMAIGSPAGVSENHWFPKRGVHHQIDKWELKCCVIW